MSHVRPVSPLGDRAGIGDGQDAVKCFPHVSATVVMHQMMLVWIGMVRRTASRALSSGNVKETERPCYVVLLVTRIFRVFRHRIVRWAVSFPHVFAIRGDCIITHNLTLTNVGRRCRRSRQYGVM